MSLGFETVPAETPAPHRISLTSSMRRVDTPARYISMMASSSSMALMVSSMVFLTISRNSSFTACSSNDTIGLDMACLLA